jgi:hypothetical protein
MKKETQFLAGLLKEGVKNNEITKTDAIKLASALISMSDSIKHYTEQNAILKKASEIGLCQRVFRNKIFIDNYF